MFKFKFIKIVFHIFLGLFLFWATLFFYGTNWMTQHYGTISMEQIIFQLKTPIEGTQSDILASFLFEVIGYSLISMLVFYLIMFIVTKKRDSIKNKLSHFKFSKYYLKYVFRKSILMISAVILFLSGFFYFEIHLQMFKYFKLRNSSGHLYEKYYVDPKTTKMTFPEKKRNLVYIFLESIEDTYYTKDEGGAEKVNLIPDLYDLALNNTSFSSSSGLKGPLESPGTTFTMGALVTETSGVPVISPVFGNLFTGKNNTLLPGVYTIGDVLHENGYNQVLMKGLDTNFAGCKGYMQEHGNYMVYDYPYAKKIGKVPKDYNVWWGFEDQKLLAFAKDEILNLAKEDKPFNLTLFTNDTHTVDGYSCQLCRDEFKYKYENVVACSGRQVAEFVNWLQQQNFYENTTIILNGDHASMNPAYFNRLLKGNSSYYRSTYTAIINSAIPVSDAIEKNRIYTKMDFYPTTLASLGVKIEGDRLALGTNLYSGKKTLAEQLGAKKLNEEFLKHSDYYDKVILGMK